MSILASDVTIVPTTMVDFSVTSSYVYGHTEESYYPTRWYEKDLIPFITSLLASVGLWHTQIALNLFPSLWLSLAAILLHLLGFVIDSISTNLVFRLKKEFDRRGQHFPLIERNKLLPNHPTLKEQIFSLDLLINFALVILVFFIPSAGVMIFIQRFCAALSNLRKQKRLKLTLYLLDKQTPS